MVEALLAQHVQYTEVVTDPKRALAKSHRAGGDGADHGCGAGVSSELTAVSKRRPMAETPYCPPMHTAPDFPCAEP
jgi:hypothetical protein